MGNVAVVTTASPTGRRPQRIGQRLQWDGVIAMAASYATGGDTITAKSLGMVKITGGIIGSAGLNRYQLIPQTNGDAKVLAIVGTTGSEVANATDLSAVTNLYAMILGR